MTFRILQNSTTADASDVNDDFYHIAQGSRLPMGGASMGYTAGVYDLGSSTKQWKDICCNNIYYNNKNNCYEKLYDTVVTASTGRISFSVTCNDVLIIACKFVNTIQTAGNYSLFLNGDSGTTYEYIQIISNKHTMNTASGFPVGQVIDTTATTQYCYSITHIFTKNVTTYSKVIMNTCLNKASGNYIGECQYNNGAWINTTDNLASLQITGSTSTAIGVNSEITIWRLVYG